MKSASYDVIVVGAGNAALCAALSAREQGASVLVLERAPKEMRGGNSAYAAGGFRMVYHGLADVQKFVDLTPEEIATSDFEDYGTKEFLADLGNTTENRIDPALAEIFVNRSTDTWLWIRKMGLKFAVSYGFQAFKNDGRWKFFGGLAIEAVGGGQGLMAAEFGAAEKQGVEIRYNTRATALLVGRSGVEGVRVTAGRVEEEIRARSVVLASGGFEANREWRSRYLGLGWDLAKVRGTRYNTGDGLKMALDAGAQPTGNWTIAHACTCDLNSPEYGNVAAGSNYMKISYTSGIMLNANGLRFLDEGADLRNYTYAKYGRVVLDQPGQFAWQIFDSKVLKLLADPYRFKHVTKVTANTLEELVAKLDGVNKEQALKTIREYNAAVRQDVPFNPNLKDGRGTTGLSIPKSNWATTLDTPPYEAYAVTCGVTFTFGGIKITTQGEVVDIEDQPIPGLFAAGELVGGIFYFNYPGGSGLTSGAVFGRIAGESAARFVKQAR